MMEEFRAHGTILRANPKGGRPMKKGHYPMDWIQESSTYVYRLGYCECGRKICIDHHEIEDILEAFNGLIEDEKPTLKVMLSDWLYRWADKLSGKKAPNPEQALINEMHERNMRAQFGLRNR